MSQKPLFGFFCVSLPTLLGLQLLSETALTMTCPQTSALPLRDPVFQQPVRNEWGALPHTQPSLLNFVLSPRRTPLILTSP